MIIGDRGSKSKGVVSYRFLFAVGAVGILSGCVTSYVGNPEIVAGRERRARRRIRSAARQGVLDRRSRYEVHARIPYFSRPRRG
jgi:chloramphenicol 3-O-phosphotransferase